MANGTLTDNGYKVQNKKLKGETLAEVDKDRRKNGCVDNNDTSQKFYAVTDVKIELKIGSEVWYPGGMNILSFKVHTNPQLLDPEVIVSAVITICVPAKLNKLSTAAKAEWKRFYTAVLKHEKEHVRDGKALAEQMLKEMRGLSVLMKTDTVDEAKMRKEALKLLGKEAVAKFGGGQIEKRINAVMSKLDSVSGHGGVKLNFDIT